MNIALATENAVKIRAVERALAEAFKSESITIHPLILDLGLPEQPVGDAIAAGAMARAEAAQEHANADFGIGIEAGLMQIPGTSRWLSVQICALIDRQGQSSVGMGPGYELPAPILEAVLSGESLRDAFERVLHQNDPERRGAVYFLSNGLIDRMELTIQGIRMALIPWLSERAT
jgi:inosine/xanthosine triphosphatase